MSPITVRPVSDTADLVAVLDASDPATFRVLGDLEGRGIGPEVHGWLAEDEDGAPAGALTVAQLCRGRWYASVMLFDERAAAPLAEVLGPSPAWEVSGAPPHVQPLVPHLTRLHSVTVAPWRVIPDLSIDVPEEIIPPRDPRCRRATGDDLDVLLGLYSTYELEPIPTRRRLRGFLERALATRPAVVTEVDGKVVGAYRADFVTSRYAFWTALTVLPEYRRQHIASGLTLEAAYLTRDELGRGQITTTAPSNPMQLRPRTANTEAWDAIGAAHGWLRSTWVKVRMGPRNRFPGHHVLRRASEILEGPVRRREKGPDIRPAP